MRRAASLAKLRDRLPVTEGTGRLDSDVDIPRFNSCVSLAGLYRPRQGPFFFYTRMSPVCVRGG
jgi:hypothetical protein